MRIDEDYLDWNPDEEQYEIHDFSINMGSKTLSSIERSVREQGFNDITRSHGDYFICLRHKQTGIEVRYDEVEDCLEVDMAGEHLSSDLKEAEMADALVIGHHQGYIDYNDSLERILEAERNSEMRPVQDF